MPSITGEQLRRLIPAEELDYTLLMSILRGYNQPRKKITQWLADGTLIRVKKGLYVFGANYRHKPYSSETLANKIYGPSAISLEYALAFYGIIPERVNIITSITPKKNKAFQTPIGFFNFRHLHINKYSIGLTLIDLDKMHSVMIASPEKAMADFFYFHCRNTVFENQDDLLLFLESDLRADFSLVRQFDKILLQEIQLHYKLQALDILIEILSNE
jgi:hypothetical protein